MLKITLNLKILIFILVLPNFEVKGCSCDTIPFNKAVENSEEIFIGEIIKAERVKSHKYQHDYSEIPDWASHWRYHFRVKKKWKGTNNQFVVIDQEGTSCDYFFEIYKRDYLVYATGNISDKDSNWKIVNRKKKGYTTWLCSRTINENYSWEENWFFDDSRKLDQLFPTAIVLKSNRVDWMQLSFGLFGIVLIGGIVFIIKNWKNDLQHSGGRPYGRYVKNKLNGK